MILLNIHFTVGTQGLRPSLLHRTKWILDERQFAETAAAKAKKNGGEIDLT
jgi:hypothetical protein